jgi:hypothetical protein
MFVVLLPSIAAVDRQLAKTERQQGIPWQSQPEPAQPGRRMHGSGEGALQHEKPFDGLSGTPCGQD